MAVQARYIDGRENDKRSHGPISTGVFETPRALWYEDLVITEAPIDALSLAACGLPAIALCGTTLRPWLLPMCKPAPDKPRRVLLAFDNDEAGEKAVEAWNTALWRYHAVVKRLRPLAGKDWNEMLQQYGAEDLAAALRRNIGT